MAYRAIGVILALAVLAACGEDDDLAGAPASSAGPGPTEPPSVTSSAPETSVAPTTAAPTSLPATLSSFPACEEVPSLEAPPGWYRDRPVYVGGDQPVETVRDWARRRPGYQEIWVDNDHFGWITVAFTADAAVRQTELDAAFPDVGVVAVEVPTTVAELRTLQTRAHQLLVDAGIEFGASGSSVTQWMVTLYVNAADERLAAALAPVAGQRICLEDAGVAATEGPQPTGGDGWRLLGDELVGETYRTGIATTDGQYRHLWEQVGMTAPRPAVDFATEVVVWFGAVYGSSCPIRLDDVVIDTTTEPALVHAVTVVPGGTGVCTGDANPHAYVAAIQRDRLPVGRFAIQLGAHDPPVGVPQERTLVDADVSKPGAVATADQIGPDRALIEASQQPQPVESGGIIEPGYPSPYRLQIHCGIAVLGQLNGIWWMTATKNVPVPPQWIGRVDPATETIVVEVLITPGPDPTAAATVNAHTVTYFPVRPESVPGCD